MTTTETRLRVLVVDNDEHVHAKAEDELKPLGEAIEMRSAQTVEEATTLASAEFFHLAFVDMKLGDQRGTAVMRHLNTLSTSCRIFVMTKHLKDFAAEVLGMLSPSFRFAGLVDKTTGEVDWFRPFVEPVFQQWRGRLIDVEGLDEVIEAVLSKAGRTDQQLAAAEGGLLSLRRAEPALADEIKWIFMGLFGSIGQPVTGARSLVTLRLLRSGFSSAVVMEALPKLRMASLDDVIQGNRCVVKIGAKSEIRKEAERYERIVRFGVAMDHRVELLGHTEADALAGVCYSFAGGEALGLKTFDDLLADGAGDGWRTVIKDIFSPTASNWYAVRSDVSALRTYFRNEVEIHLDRCFDAFETYVEGLSRLEAVRRDRDRLTIGRDVLTLPNRSVLAARGLTSRCPACLAHGDLHGGNVVVDHLDHAYFIDYRNAGVAPRLIDFAALQATARFAHVDSFRPARGWPKNATVALVEAIAATVRKEERVIGRRLVNGERWIEVAAELDKARLANFPDSDPPEALWTNFAYCLSLFRFTHMQWYRKLRLLAWFSALTAAAEKSG